MTPLPQIPGSAGGLRLRRLPHLPLGSQVPRRRRPAHLLRGLRHPPVRRPCGSGCAGDLPPFCSLLVVGPAHQLALCSDPDIFKLPTPSAGEEALSTVSLLLQFGHRMERYTRHRRSPLEQDLIARAKALLMERDGLTEEQAHRTLQKRSMDQGLTLVQTARRTLAQGGG